VHYLTFSTKARKHQDPHFRIGGRDALRGLQPVHVWHADVHQDHVRLQGRRQFHGLGPIVRVADDPDARVVLQELDKAGSEKVLVVDDQDPRDRIRLGLLGARSVDLRNFTDGRRDCYWSASQINPPKNPTVVPTTTAARQPEKSASAVNRLPGGCVNGQD
jgi:hypothetical protein